MGLVVNAVPPYAARIGLDWADQTHFWSMQTADGKLSRGTLENTPEAIEEWATQLQQRFPNQLVAVALEQSRGSVLAMLAKYSHLRLFPVCPLSLSHYRKSMYPSGAKSDPVDGYLILDYLIKHPERLACWKPDTVATRSLQFLTEERRKLVGQRVRETQILRHWLKQVFPQMLRWFDDLASPLVEALLSRWPLLSDLQKASPKTLRQFLHQHNCRSEQRMEQRLQEIRQAVTATTDAALQLVGKMRIQQSVRLLACWRDAIAELDAAIQPILESHPDYSIVASLPGAGPALEPRLIAAVGSQRERFASAQAMACYLGVAPVIEGSGQSTRVHWRLACSKFVRQTFHEWAACSIRSCDWARDHYVRQRGKGKAHHAAVRSVAYKWIRIFFRCWRDQTPYAEERYLAARGGASHPGEPHPCGGRSKPPQPSAEAAAGGER